MAERGAMGCEGPKDAAALVELLRNREVVSYVQRAMVTYDNDGPLPPALLDEELAQALVLFARRVAGRPALVPIDGQAGEPESLDYWYVSPETGACLRVLEEKARVLGNTHAIGRLLELDEVRARVADDLGAAAARDGIATDRESLRRVIVGDRAPCDGTEQFVQGVFGEFCKLLDAEYPLTVASLFCIHGSLSRLADEYGVAVRPMASRWPAESSFKMPPAPLGPGSMSHFIAMLGEKGNDPLYSVLMGSDSIWELKPFPSWNGLMEVMARAVAFSACGLPVLALVPFSRLRLDCHV